MIIKKSHLSMLAALAAAALVSCNKDGDEDSLPYLNGSLRLEGVPSYIKANDDNVYEIKPVGASHPEGLGVGYRWRVTPSESTSYVVSKDENEEGDGSFGYNFGEYNKDTLRTLTLTCEAFATGYSSLSASYSIVVVAPGGKGSIQRAGYDFNGEKILYDGIEYLVYTAPDGKKWMKQNLAYDGEQDGSKVGAPYNDAEVMSEIFGRFYTWEEATGNQAGTADSKVRGICPEGWHIPTDEEWTELANATMRSVQEDWEDMDSGSNWETDGSRISREFMAGELLDPDIPDTDEDYDSDINYGKEAASATFNTETILWEYSSDVGDPTNRSGISSIPAGYARRTNGIWSFGGAYEYAIFWTSSEDGSGKAICRVINNESPAIYRESHDKSTFAASVRCVKD